MRHDLSVKLAASAFALTLAAFPAAAQVTDGWDTGGDGIDSTEFNTQYGESGVFDSWDTDGDDSVNRQEFGEGVFNSYDRDRSGSWDDTESRHFNDDAGEEGFWDW